jgi:hypothetical protein
MMRNAFLTLSVLISCVAAVPQSALAMKDVPDDQVGVVVQSYVTNDHADQILSVKQDTPSDTYTVTASIKGIKSADVTFARDESSQKLTIMIKERPDVIAELRKQAQESGASLTDLLYGRELAEARRAAIAKLPG